MRRRARGRRERGLQRGPRRGLWRENGRARDGAHGQLRVLGRRIGLRLRRLRRIGLLGRFGRLVGRRLIRRRLAVAARLAPHAVERAHDFGAHELRHRTRVAHRQERAAAVARETFGHRLERHLRAVVDDRDHAQREAFLPHRVRALAQHEFLVPHFAVGQHHDVAHRGLRCREHLARGHEATVEERAFVRVPELRDALFDAREVDGIGERQLDARLLVVAKRHEPDLVALAERARRLARAGLRVAHLRFAAAHANPHAAGAVDDEHHRDRVLVDFGRRAWLDDRILGADVARLRLRLRRRRFWWRVGRCIRIAARTITRRGRVRLRQQAHGQQVAQRFAVALEPVADDEQAEAIVNGGLQSLLCVDRQREAEHDGCVGTEVTRQRARFFDAHALRTQRCRERRRRRHHEHARRCCHFERAIPTHAMAVDRSRDFDGRGPSSNWLGDRLATRRAAGFDAGLRGPTPAAHRHIERQWRVRIVKTQLRRERPRCARCRRERERERFRRERQRRFRRGPSACERRGRNLGVRRERRVPHRDRLAATRAGAQRGSRERRVHVTASSGQRN